MNSLKGNLKQWLKATKTSRESLAKKCHVTRGTIDNWLSEKGTIPAAKQDLLHSLMSEQHNQNVVKIDTPTLPINLNADVYEAMEQEALKLGITMRDYVAKILQYASENHEKLEDSIRELIQRENFYETKSYAGEAYSLINPSEDEEGESRDSGRFIYGSDREDGRGYRAAESNGGDYDSGR